MHVSQRSKSDACEEQIQDELQRHVKKCVCPKQYHMHKVTDGQYRVSVGHNFYDYRLFVTTAGAATSSTFTVVIVVIIVAYLWSC